MKLENKHILIAGGGTGGHLFPALAVGEWLKKQDSVAEVFYIGSTFGIEDEKFKAWGVPHSLIPVRGLQRSMTVESLSRNVLLPGRLLNSWLQTRKVFRKFEPDVVLGTGGYASALPLKVAVSRNIPFVLQEQNSFPGMTTRLFADKAHTICLGFERANDYLLKKGIITGNPVRDGIDKGEREKGFETFNLDPHIRTVFLFGGSQGSLFLNSTAAEMVKSQGPDLPFQLIWQAGPKMFNSFKTYSGSGISIVPFVERMEDAYAVSDLVISRAGALTLAELSMCGLPSILVPLSDSAGDHQLYNARVFKEAGAAELLEEKDISSDTLFELITTLLENKESRNKMRKKALSLKFENATKTIGLAVLEAAEA